MRRRPPPSCSSPSPSSRAHRRLPARRRSSRLGWRGRSSPAVGRVGDPNGWARCSRAPHSAITSTAQHQPPCFHHHVGVGPGGVNLCTHRPALRSSRCVEVGRYGDEVLLEGDRPSGIVAGNRPRPSVAAFDATNEMKLALVFDDITCAYVGKGQRLHPVTTVGRRRTTVAQVRSSSRCGFARSVSAGVCSTE